MEENKTATEGSPEETAASEGMTAPANGDASDELKVVITMKDRRAIIAVGSPGCDPVIRVAEAPSHDNLWLEVENAITQARVQWATAKQYPVHQAPAPPPPATPACQARTAAKQSAKTKAPVAKAKATEPVQHTLPLL